MSGMPPRGPVRAVHAAAPAPSASGPADAIMGPPPTSTDGAAARAAPSRRAAASKESDATLAVPDLDIEDDLDDATLGSWLRYAVAAPGGQRRQRVLDKLVEVVGTGAVRDVAWEDVSLYRQLFALMEAAWDPAGNPSLVAAEAAVAAAAATNDPIAAAAASAAVAEAANESWKALRSIYVVLTGVAVLPEFDADVAAEYMTDRWVASLFQRLLALPKDVAPDEVSFLRTLLHWVYLRFVKVRAAVRRQIGTFVARFLRTQAGYRAVPLVLEVVACIVRGFRDPLTKTHEGLFTSLLLPLHTPAGMLTETQPLIAAYHEQLVYCVMLFLERKPSLVGAAVRGVLNAWPTQRDGNSPKEVLFIHEVETLLDKADASHVRDVAGALRGMLLRSITSDFARIAQRAMQMFSNARFVELYMEAMHADTTPALFGALIGSGTKHWNASVNKLRTSVLRLLRSKDRALFARLCEDRYGGDAKMSAAGDDDGDANVGVASSDSKEGKDGMDTDGDEDEAADSIAIAPSERHVLRILRSIYTPEPDVAGAAAVDIMAESPSLLPDLRFHDLVFGRTLGSGSFSTVKYAKAIQRGVTASQWSEYAVKIMGTDLIRRLGYEGSVKREIAVLRTLSHPGLARLVASFRWRDGAYLVLEYGAGGDLHTRITTIGSLNTASTRFLCGEVAAALASIHEAGFIFGDLKPENILLTSDGHAKVTDFGAVRPITDKARAYIKASDKVVAELRDGDWAKPAPAPPKTKRFGPSDRNVEPGLRPPKRSAGAAQPPVTVTGVWPGTAGAQTGLGLRGIGSLAGAGAGAGATSTTDHGVKKDDPRNRIPGGMGRMPGTAPLMPAVPASKHALGSAGIGGGTRRPPAKKYPKNLPARPIARGVWPDPIPNLMKPTHDGSGISASGVGVRAEEEEDIPMEGKYVDEDDDGGDESGDGGGDAEGAVAVPAAEPVDPSLPTLGLGGDAAERGSGAGAGAGAGAGVGADGGGDEALDGSASPAAASSDDAARLEGTAAYLAPELVHGASPSVASDCWAFGCVVYQCLAGRPPIWAETEPEIMTKIVHFDSAAHEYPDGFPADAKALVEALLQPDPAKRLGADGGMAAVLAHPFFEALPAPAAALHKEKPPEMEVGVAAPQADAAWARRQNSMMWSPMPRKYTFKSDRYVLDAVPETDAEAATSFAPRMRVVPESMAPPVPQAMPGPVSAPGGAAAASHGVDAIPEE